MTLVLYIKIVSIRITLFSDNIRFLSFWFQTSLYQMNNIKFTGFIVTVFFYNLIAVEITKNKKVGILSNTYSNNSYFNI